MAGPATDQGAATLICESCTQLSASGLTSNVTSTLAAYLGNGLDSVAFVEIPCGGAPRSKQSHNVTPRDRLRVVARTVADAD